MAIVFVSPHQKRSQVIWITGLVIIFVLAMVAGTTFFPEIKKYFRVVESEGIKPIPKITVNVDVIDSDRVKNLSVFSSIVIDFEYTGTDANGTQVNGVITAESTEQATAILKTRNITVVNIQEADAGRANPFTSYSQSSQSSSSITTGNR